MQQQEPQSKAQQSVPPVSNLTQNQPPIDKIMQQQLLQMGFQAAIIVEALTVTSNNKDKAIEYIVNSLQQTEQQQMVNTHKNQNHLMKEQQDEDYQDVQQEYKMIFLVRMDLKMGLGKMAAQVAHATLRAYKQIEALVDKDLLAEVAYFEWTQTGSKKIVLKVENQKELIQLYDKARMNKINACYIKDAGLTQIQAGSVTVAALGPAPSSELDKITKHLKLL